MRIDVSDLLERCRKYKLHGTDPVEGIDCWWITRQIMLRRYPDMPPYELPESEDDVRSAIGAVPPPGVWGPVKPWILLGVNSSVARRVGDLVIGRNDKGFPFSMAMIDEAGRICITALPDIGACLRETRNVAGILAVYRRSACTR